MSQILKTGIITAPCIQAENLLLNSATLSGKTSSYIEDGVTVGVHTGTGSWNEAYWPLSVSAVDNPLSNKVITISLDYKVTDVTKIGNMYIGFATFNSSGGRVGDTNIAVSSYATVDGSTLTNNVWTRIYYTFTVANWTSTAATYRIQLKTNTSIDNTVSMYHKRIKVEMGNRPTPWVQAPSDIGGAIMYHGFLETRTSPIITGQKAADIANEFIEVVELIET